MKRKILLLAVILSIAVLLIAGCTAQTDDNKQVVGIAVGEFVKTEYYKGEDLFLGGAQIIVTFADGWSRRIDVTPDMITGYNPNLEGEQSVTITYKGQSTQITVNINAPSIVSIEAVEVNPETGTVTHARMLRVVEGGNPDYSKISLRVNYEVMSVIQDTILPQMISGYSPEACPPSDEPYIITISYGGKTAELQLAVVAKTVQEIIIAPEDRPTKLQYYYNNPQFSTKIGDFNKTNPPADAISIVEGRRFTEVFDPTGLKITVVYNNRTQEVVPYSSIPADEIDILYNFNKASDESPITVRYLNMQTFFYVKVIEPVTTGMEITKMPSTRGRYSFVSVDASAPAPVGSVVELPAYSSSDATKQYIVRTPETDISTAQIVEGDTIEWRTGRASIIYNDGTELTNVPMDYNDISKSCPAFTNLNSALGATGSYTIRVAYANSGWTPLQIGITVVPRSAIKMFLSENSVNTVVVKKYYVGDEVDPELIKYNVFYDNGTFLFGDISPQEWDDPACWQDGKNIAGEITETEWRQASNWVTDASLYSTYLFTRSEGASYGWDILSEDMLEFADSEKCTEPGEHSLRFQIDGVPSKTITVNVLPLLPVSISLIQDYSYYFSVGDSTSGFLENTLRNDVRAYIKYNNGTSVQRTLSSDIVSIYKDDQQVYSFTMGVDYEFTEAGDYQIRVTHDGIYQSLPLYVRDNALEPIVQSIRITANPTDDFFDQYAVFESKYDQFEFEIIYSDGTQKTLYLADHSEIVGNTVYANVKYSGDARTEDDILMLCDKNKIGKQEVVFRYRGRNATFPINIIGRWERAIQIIRLPKQLYFYGSDTQIDLDGLKVRILYNDGTMVEETNFSDPKWSFAFPTLNLLYQQYYAAKPVTVILDGVLRKLKVDYTIELVNGAVSSITYDENQQILVGYDNGDPVYDYLLRDYDDYDGISRKMLNVTYGEDLDLTSFALTVHYSYTDGTGTVQQGSTIRKITAANINYDKSVQYKDTQGNTILTRSLVITYCGKTVPIWLHLDLDRTLVGIELVEAPTQLNYTVGQNIDLRGGLVKRTFLMTDNSYSYDYIYTTNPDILVDYDNRAFPIGSPIVYESRTVAISYKGFNDGFEVTTYKKLTANLQYIDVVYHYGVAANPKISVVASGIDGFELPDISWQFGIQQDVGGIPQTVWTDVCPDKPGAYPIKVIVHENEYYEAYQEESRTLFISKRIITVNGKDFNKFYSTEDPNFNTPNPDNPTEKGYFFFGYSDTATPLVGNDKIELRLYREAAEAGENVRFGGSGEILGYTISYELVSGDNQNDYYIFDFVPGKLYIRPLSIVGSITFTGYDGLRADGEEHGVTAYYLDSNNMRVIIEQKDIIYTYQDEYGQTQVVTKIVYENGVPVVVNCPPSLAGEYTATISPNFWISGNNSVQFIISP